MQESIQDTLTRSQLIVELQKLGYDITERRIIDWQEKDLLPAFDVVGAGLGRRGRKRSSWFEGERIIEQALWVYKLLKALRNAENLYVPLWMLGYKVPYSRLRKALSEPLRAGVLSINAEASTLGHLQDLIDDTAFAASSQMRTASTEILQIPQEWLEWCTSLFFVQGYPVDDVPLQYGASALQPWQSAVAAELGTALGWLPENSAPIVKEGGDSPALIDYGCFFQRYFSLSQLNSAVEECTDTDLQAVQRDAQALVQIVRLLWRMLSSLILEMPAELQLAEEKVLFHAFTVGRMLIWADISLRQEGFGEVIDYCLNILLTELRQDIDEAEQQLADASQNFATTMSEWAAYVEKLAAIPPSDQQRSYSYYGIVFPGS